MSTSVRTSVFGSRLRAWREARGVSQRGLEAAIEKQRGYVTHLESGKFIPPPREVCDAIARHLQIDPDEVWNVAVDERLKGLDPDLYAVLDATRRGLPDLTGDERRLVEALRRLESVAGGGRSVAPSLLRIANLVATQHIAPADGAQISAQTIVRALIALDDCSARTVRRILRLAAEAVEALGEEREHLGYAREQGIDEARVLVSQQDEEVGAGDGYRLESLSEITRGSTTARAWKAMVPKWEART